MLFSRRSFLGFGLALGGGLITPLSALASPGIHVFKGRGCGCCTAWAEILRAEGFSVIDEEVHPADLVKIKLEKGVPQDLSSCHTAMIDGYVVEGHVPAADIRRLLTERPDALGLAVPEMPYGSPGMGPESERETYDVILFDKGGRRDIFTRYPAAS
jgi:hypothetical protein